MLCLVATSTPPPSFLSHQYHYHHHYCHHHNHHHYHHYHHSCTIKALEASLQGQQWIKAVEILEVFSGDDEEDEDDNGGGDASGKKKLGKYYLKLADHFAQVADLEVCAGGCGGSG